MLPSEKKIRQNIKSILKSKRLTQRTVATKMNYSAVAFSQLMSGKIPLSEKHIKRISKVIGVDTSEFYKDVWPPKRTEISHEPIKDKDLNQKMDKLGDYLQRLEPKKANRILEAFLNLVRD